MAQARHDDRWERTTRVRLWGHTPVAPAILIFFGTGILVLLALAAGAVIATAPVRSASTAPALQPGLPPAEDAAGLWWFADHAPAGEASGPGLWRRERAGDAWAWSPLPERQIAERSHTATSVSAAPAWPADPTRVQVERIADSAGKLIGYWVWNPATFEALPSGSHQWRPRWEWTPAGTPLLLLGEQQS